jgi:NAD+ kinase
MKNLRFAIFGKAFSKEHLPYLQELITLLKMHHGEVIFLQSYIKKIREVVDFYPETEIELFSTYEEIKDNVNFLFSLGGDGSLLDTITLVRDSQIPIIGINLGRMGFLASIPKDKIQEVVESILKKDFKLDRRSLLSLEDNENSFGNLNFALNEVSIHKKENSSMITLKVWVNDQFLNSYWADGLIVSTPTGSTGYSLSCNGPIICPESQSFVITPIASHNLTVRPIVIPDTSVIRILVEGREKEYFVGLDSRSKLFNTPLELVIRKELFNINLLQTSTDNFFSTIRKKLLWGSDIRN